MEYHVSIYGSDGADGTAAAPFRTINRAAQLACPGDIVTVHEGTYREWVDPKYGGTSEQNRIIYRAAPGEKAVIKGSEEITGWEKVENTVWKKCLPNTFFGDYNPFAIAMEGDWFDDPMADYRVHLGDVYLNGVSMFEATGMEDLYDHTPREKAPYHRPEEPHRIAHPERTIYKWLAVVDEENTTLYCNFQSYDPNAELVEINVRQCCFYPRKTGVNFITLRGFEIAHAACPWIPPTVDQIGMVGPHWSKGWIIEHNHLHDAKCSAVSLGKEASTGDNLTVFDRKSGHRHQLEAVFAAARIGWSKDTVGSHIVRNNEIHDCGQNGIVGHLGCIFSHIYHNHIYNIGTKMEFRGSELGGVKFHGAIDTIVENNLIHDCTLGTWLDWQAQGLRLTGNIYYNNIRDVEIEVSHGPCLVDNNLFLSARNYDCYSQGNAFVHNLFAGNIHGVDVRNRTTPYHYPHSTQVAGYSETLGGDERYYNNLFAGMYARDTYFGEERAFTDFADYYDNFTEEGEYWQRIHERPRSNLGKFLEIPQPVWFDGNGYSGCSKVCRHDASGVKADGLAAQIEECDGVWKLKLHVPQPFTEAFGKQATTEKLGRTRLSDQYFEQGDGAPIDFASDILGQRRGAEVIPGPFAALQAGEQEIVVWRRG